MQAAGAEKGDQAAENAGGKRTGIRSAARFGVDWAGRLFRRRGGGGRFLCEDGCRRFRACILFIRFGTVAGVRFRNVRRLGNVGADGFVRFARPDIRRVVDDGFAFRGGIGGFRIVLWRRIGFQFDRHRLLIGLRAARRIFRSHDDLFPLSHELKALR